MNDLFFLHERGTQSGAQALALSLGNSVAPIICGFLVQSKGWRIYHWLIMALCVFNLILVILFSPETAYARDLHLSVDVTGVNADTQNSISSENGESVRLEEMKGEVVMAETVSNSPVPPQKTLWQELKPWNSPRKDFNLSAAYLRPWVIWAYPSFVWSELTYSLHVVG